MPAPQVDGVPAWRHRHSRDQQSTRAPTRTAEGRPSKAEMRRHSETKSTPPCARRRKDFLLRCLTMTALLLKGFRTRFWRNWMRDFGPDNGGVGGKREEGLGMSPEWSGSVLVGHDVVDGGGVDLVAQGREVPGRGNFSWGRVGSAATLSPFTQGTSCTSSRSEARELAARRAGKQRGEGSPSGASGDASKVNDRQVTNLWGREHRMPDHLCV